MDFLSLIMEMVSRVHTLFIQPAPNAFCLQVNIEPSGKVFIIPAVADKA